MPAGAGIAQVHGDLRVLDTPGGAGVLPLHPDRVRPLLHVPGLVDDQHRTGLAEVLDDVVAQILLDAVGVPSGPRQQMLHPIGGGVAGMLGQRPAVLARRSASSASRNPRTRRRHSIRPNRPAIRSSSSSTPADQPAGPTLARATTAGPSDVLTPDDGHAVAALVSRSRSSDLRLEY